MRYRASYGFTIVELLIVIVVIGILAAITIVAFNGVQTRAKTTKVNSDIASLTKAIELARNTQNKTLLSITGSGCTRCSCPYAAGDTTSYATLPKTHSCWTAYFNTLTQITNASGVNLNSLRDGDPWGSPYAIDENEGEGGNCNRDSIWSFGSSTNINGGTSLGVKNIPLYSAACA